MGACKLIIISGPMGCGKSELVKAIKADLREFKIDEAQCKEKLHELTRIFFNLTSERYDQLYNDRSLKEVPQDDLKITAAAAMELRERIKLKDIYSYGDEMVRLTIREAMIFVSEVIIKPAFGDDYFGVARAKKIEQYAVLDLPNQPIHLFIDDSAFGTMEEIQPALDILGEDNVFCIRVFGRGEFSPSDSRRYVPNGALNNMVDVLNDGLESDFHQSAIATIKNFIYFDSQ